jgi:hypothetical protein
MRFGEDAVEVVYACIRHNIPMSCITAAQAGATAPATLAGFLAQSLAETLASLVMVHAIQPGHPMVFSNWPLVIDLRTGAFTGGSGETAVLNAASAQLLELAGPALGRGLLHDRCQGHRRAIRHGKGLTSLAAALAGGNLIYESSGMTASLLGASFEAFVLDDEMHSHIYRALRGIEVTEDNLGLTRSATRCWARGISWAAQHTFAGDGARLFLSHKDERIAQQWIFHKVMHGIERAGANSGIYLSLAQQPKDLMTVTGVHAQPGVLHAGGQNAGQLRRDLAVKIFDNGQRQILGRVQIAGQGIQFSGPDVTQRRFHMAQEHRTRCGQNHRASCVIDEAHIELFFEAAQMV